MLLTLPIIFASWVAATSATPIESTVSTQFGPVFTGPRDPNGILVFKGIPYATPPVGRLRWRATQPPMPWSTALNASSFAPACLYFNPFLIPPFPESEDCLYMNVWTPAKRTDEALPVMVFIHGGGFEMESAANPLWGGTNFAKRGVVLISFDYRMGNLGFLALPALDDEDPTGKSGNYGLLDMIQGLRWVRENAAAFGGDPGNILLFGESAGAHAVGLLMASPLATGLFDKAIMESGSFWDTPHGSITDFDQARKMGSSWARKFTDDTSLETLRDLPVQTVVNTSLWIPSTDPAVTAFSPNIDNFVLPASPGTVFRAGKQVKVPLLGGWNLFEGAPFLPLAFPHNTSAEFINYTSRFFGVQGRNTSTTNKTLEVLYPAATVAEATNSSYTLLSDLMISEQTWEALDLHASTSCLDGKNQHCCSIPTYAYHFTYTSPYSPLAPHGGELPFVFGNFIAGESSSVAAGPSDYALSDKMMTYWVNFAKTGNPNAPDSSVPYWPRYRENSNSSLKRQPGCLERAGMPGIVLELGANVAPLKNFNFERFTFIESYRTDGVLPTEWRNFV